MVYPHDIVPVCCMVFRCSVAPLCAVRFSVLQSVSHCVRCKVCCTACVLYSVLHLLHCVYCTVCCILCCKVCCTVCCTTRSWLLRHPTPSCSASRVYIHTYRHAYRHVYRHGVGMFSVRLRRRLERHGRPSLTRTRHPIAQPTCLRCIPTQACIGTHRALCTLPIKPSSFATRTSVTPNVAILICSAASCCFSAWTANTFGG